MCDLYEIILIIIMISLGQMLLSYIANTSRTHAYTRAHTPPSSFRLSLFDGSVSPKRDEFNGWSLLHPNTNLCVSPRFLVFFDTNSLTHFPRRSSKNCDLQFANFYIQTDLRRIMV